MKTLNFIKAIALFSIIIGATPNVLSADTGTKKAAPIDVLTKSGREVIVSVINDNIIKVTNIPEGASVPETPTSVIKTNSEDYTISSAPGVSVMTTRGGIVVRVDSLSGSVDITAGPKRGISDSGLRNVSDDKQQIELSTMGSGSFYGAGERGYSFNLAGDTLVM